MRSAQKGGAWYCGWHLARLDTDARSLRRTADRSRVPVNRPVFSDSSTRNGGPRTSYLIDMIGGVFSFQWSHDFAFLHENEAFGAPIWQSSRDRHFLLNNCQWGIRLHKFSVCSARPESTRKTMLLGFSVDSQALPGRILAEPMHERDLCCTAAIEQSLKEKALVLCLKR